MCGILGLIGDKVDDRFLIGLLSHRGPDAEGLWSSSSNEYPVTLAHARLSIIDVSSIGNQPMHSSCGRYVIVFNGEIYNYLELRESLIAKGYAFKTNSDTEVFLTGLVDEGPSFQLKCNGMWAFCLWDKNSGEAIFGRDRFGKKPLFYTKLRGGGLVFASEMKALYPYLSVTPSVQIDRHFKYLFDYEHTSECVIDGVERIEPGYWAKYDHGNLKTYRWWNTLDHLESVPDSYEEQVERWRELFLDAVKIRMRADVKIGTALSGGLDSSAIFCAMAHLSNINSRGFKATEGSWKNGFCAHYPGSDMDEVKWAKIVTNYVGCDLNSVLIDPTSSAWSLSSSLYQVEDPYLTMPLPMLTTYRAISNAGVKVTLDGHGADELFSGYGHISRALFQANPEQASEIISIMESTQSGSYELNRGGGIKSWLALQTKLRCRKIASNLKGALINRKKVIFPDQDHPRYKAMNYFDKSLYEIFHVTVLPTLLRNYDRYSMASGVEIRMPFLDWRLVAFTFSLPWTSKLGRGFTKRIMRDALKDILPDEIRLRRDKIGWNAPVHEWFLGPLKQEVDRLAVEQGYASSVSIAWERFKRLKNPRYQDGEKMWLLLMPYFWRKSLVDARYFIHKQSNGG